MSFSSMLASRSSVRSVGRPIFPAVVAAAGMVAAAALLAACQPAAQDGSEGEAASEAPGGAAVQGREAAPAITEQQVIEMERGLWEALEAGDYEGFGARIADDIVLVGGEGVVGKGELMAQLEGSTVEAYEVGDFQVMQPGSGVAVVTYSYSETFRPADADSAAVFEGWATSIWENREGGWMTVFHQSSELPGGE